MSLARAAVLVSPRTYEVKEFPIPSPASGCLLVKNLLSGICGTDKHTFEGYTTQYSGTNNPSSTPFPIIQVHENVGEVVEIGSDVVDFEGVVLKVGDRVVVGPNVTCGRCYACTQGLPYTLCSNIRDYGNTISAKEAPHLFGGWAEYMYVLPQSYIFRVPDELPSEIAVLAELFAVTVGLDRAQSLGSFPSGGFRFGNSVLVYGAGPLGLCHVAKARMLGADKTPDNAKGDEAKRNIAENPMCVVTSLGNKFKGDDADERPVENPHQRIPDVDRCRARGAPGFGSRVCRCHFVFTSSAVFGSK